MPELFRAGGPEARGPRQVLAFSLSAAGHAGILALAMWIPRPVPPTQVPAVVTVSLYSTVVEPASEEEADGTAGDFAEPTGAGSPLAVEERVPSRPARVEPRPPPAAPPVEPEASEPVAAPQPVLAEPRSVAPTLTIISETEAEPGAPAREPDGGAVDGAGPPSPAAGPEDGQGTGGEPAGVAGGLGSGHGGGEGRGGRRGKKRRAGKTDVLPALVHGPKPPYPARSRDLGEEGTVIIAILVGEDGKVRESRVATSSGHPLLDGSALATVRQKWRFQPGRSAGAPVERWVRVPVEFRIRKR